ncbi:MAG: hypothetical protein JST90_13705 [Bacteroidetes bacterium]|nr:hypothetical protein [Bacteroidota bacterium]
MTDISKRRECKTTDAMKPMGKRIACGMTGTVVSHQPMATDSSMMERKGTSILIYP